MTTTDANLKFYERNDETVYGVITNRDGTPFDITNYDVEMYLKEDAAKSDDTGTVLSTTSGEVTKSDPENGEFEVAVSSTVTATPKQAQFVRVDVLSTDGKRKTCALGEYRIIDT